MVLPSASALAVAARSVANGARNDTQGSVTRPPNVRKLDLRFKRLVLLDFMSGANDALGRTPENEGVSCAK